MTEKEIGELRRRFRLDRTNINHIIGCYVNQSGEIVSQFNQSLTMMPEDEGEKFLAVFKKTLSGGLGKNLHDIVFSTPQVASGEEHQLLSKLRTSTLKDEEALTALFEKIISCVHFEDNYAIFLGLDSYDVPYRGKDGHSLSDSSDTMFTYLICSVCPVKTSKPALVYQNTDEQFHNRPLDWILSPPEMGFVFPAFDDRATNLYGALYYCRSNKDTYESFVDTIFKTKPPMAAALQKDIFNEMLQEALGEDCSLEVVQNVNLQLNTVIEEHKANKEPIPLSMTKEEIAYVLENSGATKESLETFTQEYDKQFGENTDLNPKNIVDGAKLSVTTPDAVIKVSSEQQDLVETRVINGVKYVLIRAEEGLEVNGIPVHIGE